jgi:hypothetical protein
MQSSDRTRSDTTDETHADSEADHEGQVSGTNTSVRARWRIEVIDEPVASRPEAPESETVALVRLRLQNPAPVAQHVSVQNSLSGPVLFPRRKGVAEAGWDREGFAGAVAAESERALGYACPAPVRTPPITLREVEDRSDGRVAESTADRTTPEAVVRTYGDSAPPAGVTHGVGRAGIQRGEDRRQPRPGGVESMSEPSDGKSTPDAKSKVNAKSTPDTNATALTAGADPLSTPPTAVCRWLDRIEGQIGRAEALDDPTVPEATGILAESGGLDAALDEADELSTAAVQLRALAERANELAAQADAVEVSEQSLRRLA